MCQLYAKGPPLRIVAKPQQVVQLQSTPTTFSLSDMRLFHHFIIKSYPHLPLGNDETWTCDIPAFAHHYDYLMHAMLSVAASHLTLFSTSELSEVALTHRGLAIAGLNKAMSRSPECSSDADAMMAACYALSFQSSYTDDGLMDFLIFIRGCSLISFTAFQNPAESVFRDNTTEGHMQIMRPKLRTAPTVDPFLASTASDAVDSIRHLCSHKIEWEFHQLLVDITHSLLETSQQAYIRLLAIYGICGSMSNEDFEHFSNPENHVCQILLAHFLAIQSILAPLTNLELEGRGRQAPAKARVPWVDRIAQMTPQSQRVYLTWPLEVANAVRSELEVAATSSGLNESLILRKTQGCYSYLI
ncbi:MAG: hypothetical protein M1825_001759 [Sarcosagium campestre]|nr:MAG: hypothetical protein M1825_001759 [Sarcosagium campestre]